MHLVLRPEERRSDRWSPPTAEKKKKGNPSETPPGVAVVRIDLLRLCAPAAGAAALFLLQATAAAAQLKGCLLRGRWQAHLRWERWPQRTALRACGTGLGRRRTTSLSVDFFDTLSHRDEKALYNYKTIFIRLTYGRQLTFIRSEENRVQGLPPSGPEAVISQRTCAQG